MRRPRHGASLVADIVTRHDVPEAKARAIVREVLDVAAAEARDCAGSLGRADQELGLAARTVALRIEYARDRIAPPGRRPAI